MLAKEQFDEAKKYLTPAQFGLVAAPLEKLTLAAREAKEPAAHAAACLKLGNAWASARGKLLTYPLDTDERRHEVYLDHSAEADVRRADSAPFVGASGNYKLDLENRDELRHAFNWWLEASDAKPGSPETAQALWLALKAMPPIADVSPFTVERAGTRKWGDVARKLYDRLRTECPDSVEAKRYAVTWGFAVPKKEVPDDPGAHFSTPYMRNPVGERMKGSDAMGILVDTADYQESQALSAKIASLEAASRRRRYSRKGTRGKAEKLRGPGAPSLYRQY